MYNISKSKIPKLPASYGSPLETSPVAPEMGSLWVSASLLSPQTAFAADEASWLRVSRADAIAVAGQLV